MQNLSSDASSILPPLSARARLSDAFMRGGPRAFWTLAARMALTTAITSGLKAGGMLLAGIFFWLLWAMLPGEGQAFAASLVAELAADPFPAADSLSAAMPAGAFSGFDAPAGAFSALLSLPGAAVLALALALLALLARTDGRGV